MIPATIALLATRATSTRLILVDTYETFMQLIYHDALDKRRLRNCLKRTLMIITVAQQQVLQAKKKLV
jgi:hypothetical protein